MGKLCVFCGSGMGRKAEYAAAAEALGRVLAENGIELVYGGGSVGLMGTVARAALRHGGKVTGIIPQSLADREVAFNELENLKIVGSMHERKAAMIKLADAFVALPGGIGTLEEFFEVLTWTQLGIHSKPCALLNVRGYYDRLLQFLDHTAAERFIEKEHRKMLIVERSPSRLLKSLAAFRPPRKDKAAWALKESRTLERWD
ncbi:MAG: TIGR00730 family Rossman fold protein [Elusimicrobia bacterium]|nr:TIGR00730 family Rossman fold protein [Elusimicrobiota bacterium]